MTVSNQSDENQRKSLPYRANSMCKGPEAGELGCLRTGKEACVAACSGRGKEPEELKLEREEGIG